MAHVVYHYCGGRDARWKSARAPSPEAPSRRCRAFMKRPPSIPRAARSRRSIAPCAA